MKKHYIIPIYVPYYGNDKTFIFNHYKKTNEKLSKADIKESIDNYLDTIDIKDNQSTKIEISFFGGNFFTLSKKKQIEFLEMAYEYVKSEKVTSIQISANPKDIDKDILKLLKKYKVKTIELIIYSSNDYILKKLNCSYVFSDIKKVCRLIRWNGFKLNFQMYVGIPESTRIDEINTAKALVRQKPKLVKIHPVLVLKNTNLEKLYNAGDYSPLSLVQTIEICKEIVTIFAHKNIDTYEFSTPECEGQEFISGPYHLNLRSLIESAMWYDSIVSKIKRLNAKVKEVEVTINPLDSEHVIGYQNENVLKLKEYYDVDLILNQDETLKQGKSKITITKTYDDFLKT